MNGQCVGCDNGDILSNGKCVARNTICTGGKVYNVMTKQCECSNGYVWDASLNMCTHCADKQYYNQANQRC